ncbi:polysaccharide pyruvyl transferase family protein [Algibacter sp.]|nr:polysaccharide pyruvyl transferase family protein [Algibacter sp.]
MAFYSIDDLKNIIDSNLSGLIQSNCVLLNTPEHVNIGDQLIWQGEMDYLTSKGIKPHYISSLFTFDWREFSKDTLILLHGGGNFGDLWEGHQEFRLKVVERYKNNKILIFPQSVQYNNQESLLNDAKLFSAHQNLTICARDEFSYKLLREHFNNNILMLPDMAFCSSYSRIVRDKNIDRTLLMKRTDREVPSKINYTKYNNFEIRDWPSFDNSIINFPLRVVEKLNRMFSDNFYKKFNKNRDGDTTFGLGVHRDKDYLVNQGVKFLSEYDLVISTRLHGHILSLLLGIPSIMIDNNYGKNSRFYNTWLKDIPNSKIVSSESELDLELK